MKLIQPDVKFAKSYASVENLTKAVEALEAKMQTELRVTIATCGDKHDRFSPVIHLEQSQQWMAGGIAHHGYMVTTF